MGTWDTSIEGNDVFQDVYSAFMERYKSGEQPRKIKQDILLEFQYYFADKDDQYNALFGLSKALWETKYLDKETLDKVRKIVMNQSDLQLWKELGATDEIINDRKKQLDKFLETISTKKANSNRRTQKKFECERKVIMRLVSPDGRKTIDIGEDFADNKYIQTNGVLIWESGGGSIFYFSPANQNISVNWINSATLLIIHDKTIAFLKKDEKAFFLGEEVEIRYLEK